MVPDCCLSSALAFPSDLGARRPCRGLRGWGSMKVKDESEKVSFKFNTQKTKIMASGPITSWQIDGETVRDYFWGAPKSLQMVTAAMKLKDAYSLEGKL